MLKITMSLFSLVLFLFSMALQAADVQTSLIDATYDNNSKIVNVLVANGCDGQQYQPILKGCTEVERTCIIEVKGFRDADCAEVRPELYHFNLSDTTFNLKRAAKLRVIGSDNRVIKNRPDFVVRPQ